MIKEVYGEVVDNFVRRKVRVTLANLTRCNPVDISDNDVDKVINQMRIATWKIHLNKVNSFENGVKKESIIFAFVDDETGYHYDNTVIV